MLDGLDHRRLFVHGRDDAQRLGPAVAQNLQLQRLAGVCADLLLERTPAVDRLAVDGDDAVAVPQARLSGRRLRLDVSDLRRELLVRGREDDEVKRNREDQVGRRTGESDQAPLPRRLLEKGAPPVLRRDFLVRIVAGELDVSAQRQK